MNVEAWFEAIEEGNIEQLNQLVVENSSYLTVLNKAGNNPLQQAVLHNNLLVVQFLVEKIDSIYAKSAADVINQANAEGTALHYAIVNNNFNIVELLVRSGADVSIKNKAGKTPIDLVKSGSNIDIGLLRGYEKINKQTESFTRLEPSKQLAELLEDFPSSELWRLHIDGWQQNTKGPKDFSDNFHKGMMQGFEFIRQNFNTPITPEIIEKIYRTAYLERPELKSLRNGADTYFGVYMIPKEKYDTSKESDPRYKKQIESLEFEAGISEDGLPEFFTALKNACSYPDKESTPKIYLDITVKGTNAEHFRFNPNESDAYEKFCQYMKESYKTKTEAKPLMTVNVLIHTNKAVREQIIEYMNSSIFNFYKKIEACKQLPQNDNLIIAEIANLTRDFHQSHYFEDGCGRTFVFLMTNLLLMQQVGSLMITQTPAHFAGFSTGELVEEILRGMHLFKEYTITDAKKYLSELTDKNCENIVSVKALLNKNISVNPIIALAQINELFQRIADNKLIVPKNYKPSINLPGFGLVRNPLSLISSEIVLAHNRILDLLKQVYFEKIQEIVHHPTSDIYNSIGYFSEFCQSIDEKKPTPQDIFRQLIQNHNIINDTKHLFLEGKIDKDMKKMINQEIEKYKLVSASSNILAHIV